MLMRVQLSQGDELEYKIAIDRDRKNATRISVLPKGTVKARLQFLSSRFNIDPDNPLMALFLLIQVDKVSDERYRGVLTQVCFLDDNSSCASLC